ncbi:hypothetical protein CP973_19480 [Streptomyces albofaciens JCM 4342]|uniref:hypothetical protein n=1 Tax=Streptomyces albofaciens TaxID=66866 RepID=UPI00123B4BAC|nr:hypothetical protein [Streptomyces albofaciens]KAA6223813.1 hypothetical protein CP973_19480 [Streptomyces albofaciens JCM 4342]
MSVQQSVAACGTARSRFGSGETAVVIVIIALAVLMTLRGLPLPEVTAVLTSAGLLAVTVIRIGQGRVVRGAALRSAGRALLSCGPA